MHISQTILVADDHSLIRRATTISLKDLMPQSTIYNAEDFEEVVRLIDQHRFDLIILDISMPGGDSLKMLDVIFRKDRSVKVLILSGLDEQLYAIRYIKAGAHGYLHKTAKEEDFAIAVKTVMKGEQYLSVAVKDKLINNIFYGDPVSSGFNLLSDRELEVAGLLTKGVGLKEISAVLNLHAATVSTYKSRIFSKLGINNLVELIEKMRLHEHQ
jgi:two-component system invasion response regulator UvrY